MDQLDTSLKSLCRICAGAFMLLAIGAWPTSAHAHAMPTSEEPSVGSTMHKPPPDVVITFDSPIESLFAQLGVFDGAGRNETTGRPAVSDNQRVLSVPLRRLDAGDYTVKWSVVAEDGHRTEGSFQFTVAPGAQ